MTASLKKKLASIVVTLVIILLLLSPAVLRELKRSKVSVAVIQHQVAYHHLDKFILAKGKIPTKLSQIEEYEQTVKVAKKQLEINYFPDAWDKNDEVLFFTPLLNDDCLVITFGDKRQSYLEGLKFREKNNSEIVEIIKGNRDKEIILGNN
jgi:type II secretory pathway pseudopilin PulG